MRPIYERLGIIPSINLPELEEEAGRN